MIDLRPGDQFFADIAPVAQSRVNAFGDLMGTNGRIHTDPDFARTTPLKGPVVQGGLIIAPVHDALCRLVGRDRWLRHGRLDAKFISFTRPDEGARLDLAVESASDAGVRFSFAITKTDGTKVVVGDIDVER